MSGIFGAGGVPITAVAARLGLADPGVTQAVYAHRMKGAAHLAADAIGRLFDAPPAEDASSGGDGAHTAHGDHAAAEDTEVGG